MVTNSYLISIGLSDFSLIRPQCIFTGGWSALFLGLAAFPSLFICVNWEHTRAHSFAGGFLKGAFLLFGAVTGATVVATLLRLLLGISGNVQDEVSWGFWWEIWRLTPPGWGTLLFTMNFAVIAFILPSFGQAASSRDLMRVVGVALSCLAVPSALLIGYEMYPSVSRALGGGRMESSVVFWANKDAEALVGEMRKQANHSQDGYPSQEFVADLIFQNSDVYVVQLTFCSPDKHFTKMTTVLDRKLISAYFPVYAHLLMPPSPEPLTCP